MSLLGDPSDVMSEIFATSMSLAGIVGDEGGWGVTGDGSGGIGEAARGISKSS